MKNNSNVNTSIWDFVATVNFLSRRKKINQRTLIAVKSLVDSNYRKTLEVSITTSEQDVLN